MLSDYIESITGPIDETEILIYTNFSNIYYFNSYYIKQPRDISKFLNSLFEAQFNYHIQNQNRQNG